jgi:glycerol kinase
MGYILAIDQGTTSSRAIVFDAKMRPIAMAQQEFPQIFPASGWVEHAPDAIWNSVLATCRMAIKQAGIDAGQLAGIGLTNQRETTLIWDRKTGAPIGNAIVWQDRRTAARCTQLKEQGHEA